MFSTKVGIDLLIAVLLSAILMFVMGALSYASKNYVFFYAASATVALMLISMFVKDKL